MIVFWLLTLGMSAAAFIVTGGNPVGHFAANGATDTVLDSGVWGIIGFYLGTFIQLFGEDLVTILPFLAVLALLKGEVVTQDVHCPDMGCHGHLVRRAPFADL